MAKRVTRNVDVCLQCDSFHTNFTDGYLKEDIPERQRQVVKDYWEDSLLSCANDANVRGDHTKPGKDYIKMAPTYNCPYVLEHLVVLKQKRS